MPVELIERIRTRTRCNSTTNAEAGEVLPKPLILIVTQIVQSRGGLPNTIRRLPILGCWIFSRWKLRETETLIVR